MKKYGVLLVLLSLMFIPIIAKADASLTNEFVCEKYGGSNGIEEQRCYFKYKVNGTVTKVNTIKLTLELTNVRIIDIQANTENGWYLKEQNGNTLTFETSKTSLTGEEILGFIIVETIDKNDSNCNINLKNCEFINAQRNCSIFKDKYYNKNGEITDAKTYQKECVPHYCVIWDDGTYFGRNGDIVDKLTYQKECEVNKCVKLSDGTYYDKSGNVTDEETYKKECTDAYKCLKKGGQYYDKNGNPTTEIEYQKQCEVNKCVKLSDGTYYDKSGNATDEETYKKECETLDTKYYCEEKDGKYYGINGNLVDKINFQKECQKNYCTIIGDTYYGVNGVIVSKDAYDNECSTTNKYYCAVVNNQYYGINGDLVSKDVYDTECAPK